MPILEDKLVLVPLKSSNILRDSKTHICWLDVSVNVSQSVNISECCDALNVVLSKPSSHSRYLNNDSSHGTWTETSDWTVLLQITNVRT